MDIVILGLSVTSSWGNGHATNFRALMQAAEAAGHRIAFFERDVPWYAAHRDLPSPPWGETILYDRPSDLQDHADRIAAADLVVVGSYVPDGIDVADRVLDQAEGVTAFYDIDTPVTVAALAAGRCEYLDAGLVPRFDLYLSFTGGPMLDRLALDWGARRPRPFHCFVDPVAYAPLGRAVRWDFGYLGTYSDDRQSVLDRLLLEAARRRPDLRFVVAGPGYPAGIRWPANVERIEHLAPPDHPEFYASQRMTLNVTRADMVRAGWSPSVRLFEAAACGTPSVSDRWPGLHEFFAQGTEILTAADGDDVLAHLDRVGSDERDRIGRRARARVLAAHTAAHRVRQLEQLVAEVGDEERTDGAGAATTGAGRS